MIRRLFLALFLVYSVAVVADDISPERYLSHIKVLASDDLKGRGNDMPELQKAARYVESQFKACGLKPVNGSYLQKYTAVVGAEAGPNNKLAGYTNMDFQVLGLSDSGKFSGPVVFAGYGITWTPHYDDYAGIDATGKIVLILRGAPQNSAEFEAKSRLVEKVLTAKSHGAVAVLLVNKASANDDDRFIPISADSMPERLGMPVLQIKRAVADKILAPLGTDLAKLEAGIDKEMSGHPLDMRITLTGEADMIRKTREVENVVGLLPGTDLAHKDEVIALGSHYDHLGLGGRDSLAPDQQGKIHHGADDNASGTAGVIELACAMRGSKLHRSVLFMSFSGEELGLLGSAAYTKSPLIPLDKTEAMLNMDMIGRVKDHKLYIGNVGSATEFRQILEDESKGTSFKIEYSATGTDSSDHLSFNLKHVPTLFFFSGLHSDYHKPSDTWDKIDAQSAAEVLALVRRVTMRLDTLPANPQWVKVAEPPRPTGGGGGGYGPWFGSIPDMGESENGVKFADVRAGSPAEKAGLKPGDVMIAWNGREIKNLYDFTHELQNSKIGDKVAITVIRGKEKVNVDVTLAKRP